MSYNRKYQRLSSKLTRSLDHDDDDYYMNMASMRNNPPAHNVIEYFDDEAVVNTSKPRETVTANKSRDTNVTRDNLQETLLTQLLTKTDNDDDLSMTKYANSKNKDDKPIKVYPIDVYIMLDSTYRNSQYDINDKFTFNVTIHAPANTPGNISINNPLSNIIEMEVIGKIKVPITDKIYEQYARQAYGEAVLEIPELSAQSFIEYGNKKFHFNFDISEEGNKYILTPKISKFIFTKPIKTDSITLNFRFPYDKFNFVNDMIEGQIEYPKILQAFKLNDILDVINGTVVIDNYLVACGRGQNAVMSLCKITTDDIITNNWQTCIIPQDFSYEIVYIDRDPTANNSNLFVIAGKNTENGDIIIKNQYIIYEYWAYPSNLSQVFDIGSDLGVVNKIKLFTYNSLSYIFVLCKQKYTGLPCVFYASYSNGTIGTWNSYILDSQIISCTDAILIDDYIYLSVLATADVSIIYYTQIGVLNTSTLQPIPSLLTSNSFLSGAYNIIPCSFSQGQTTIFVFAKKSATAGSTVSPLIYTTDNFSTWSYLTITQGSSYDIDFSIVSALSNVTLVRELTQGSNKYIELSAIALGILDDDGKNAYCPVKIIINNNNDGTIIKLGRLILQDPPSSLVYKSFSTSHYRLYISAFNNDNIVHKVLSYGGLFIDSEDITIGDNTIRWYVVGNKNYKLCKFLSSKNTQPVGFSDFISDIDTIHTIFCNNNLWLIGGATVTSQETFYGGNNKLLYYSDDYGITWQPTNVTFIVVGLHNVTNIVYNQGIYHAVINSYTDTYIGFTIMYSLDGKLWSYIHITNLSLLSNPFYPKAVAYYNSKWVCVGNNNEGHNIMTSTDGINWTFISNGQIIGLLADYEDVNYDKNEKLWYVVGYLYFPNSVYNITHRIIVSDDTQNWTVVHIYFNTTAFITSPPITTLNVNQIGIKKLYITDNYSLAILKYYTNDKDIPNFYLLGYSTDKRNWDILDINITNPQNILPNLFWDGQIWTLNIFGSNRGIYTSEDGLTWIRTDLNNFTYCTTGGKMITDSLNFITNSHSLTDNDYISMNNISDIYVKYNNATRPINVVNSNILSMNAELTTLLYNSIIRPCDYDSINYSYIHANLYSSVNISIPEYLTLQLSNMSFLKKGDKCTIINNPNLDDNTYDFLTSIIKIWIDDNINSISANNFNLDFPSSVDLNFSLFNSIFKQDANGNYPSFEITDISSVDSRITIYSPLFTIPLLRVLKILEAYISFEISVSPSIIEEYNNSQKTTMLYIGSRSVRIPMRFRCLTTAPTNYITPV